MKKIYFNDYFKIKESAEHLNIPLDGDLEAFLCPYKIVNNRQTELPGRVYYRSKAFMEILNGYIQDKNNSKGLKLLFHLHESKEFHLGYSEKNKGSAVGKDKAKVIYEALENNDFVRKKITITDEPQNVLLLVAGIGPDNMSDILSNVCKDIFAEFTYNQCIKYNIPTEKFIIEYFNDQSKKWDSKDVLLPSYQGKGIILIPKILGSPKREYYQMYNRFIAKNHIAIDILNGKKPTTNFERHIRTSKKGIQTPIVKNIMEDFGKPKGELIDFVREYGDKTLLDFQEHIKKVFSELDF